MAGNSGRIAAGAVAFLVIGVYGFRLTYNTTPSLPVGIYRIAALQGEPRRGDFVGFCLEGETARLAQARGYVHRQALEPYVYRVACASGAAAIGKPVAGVPGDTVDVNAEGVRINGVPISGGSAAARDRRERTMPRVGPGRRVLGPGEYWLQSTYSRWSFDSRYFGPVRREQIIDLRIPVLATARCTPLDGVQGAAGSNRRPVGTPQARERPPCIRASVRAGSCCDVATATPLFVSSAHERPTSPRLPQLEQVVDERAEGG